MQGISNVNAERSVVRCIAWLGPSAERAHGALDSSRITCDLERVEILLELNGPSFADRPDVSDLCFEFLSSAAKPAMIVAENHNFSALALKYLVNDDDELVETRR